MSLKQVHWKLTVDEYVERNSPESWTSPLPSASQKPVPTPPPFSNFSGQAKLHIHPALTPQYALQLDFSFPSDAFRRNPQLTQNLLDAPACHPPRTSLNVRVAAGMFKWRVEVKHGTSGQPVTVGDVLTKVQSELRQYDYGKAPPEARPYMERRIETVNGYCDRRDKRIEATTVAAERQGGRFVDHLLGQTQFAGLTIQLGHPDHYWQLQLEVPPRYMYAD
ncbi:hypothetical protein C8F04DRAFT_1134122 [Mycena alexandri]|uniref:DUF6699 domain-containing protein n=1 Tax=Mycena alexandri TaxID=1745969 RepID=A0AAD6SDK9_9AGAR|nr:hypothetical protein C8F04DRAFT_1134122 [Mycena alexandri]